MLYTVTTEKALGHGVSYQVDPALHSLPVAALQRTGKPNCEASRLSGASYLEAGNFLRPRCVTGTGAHLHRGRHAGTQQQRQRAREKRVPIALVRKARRPARRVRLADALQAAPVLQRLLSG